VREIAREGILEEQEREIIDSIFEFTIRRVGDIMVPNKFVVYVDYAEGEDSIKEKSKKYGFIRFPVFKNRELLGMINIFDFFYNVGDWHNYIRPLRKVDINERLDVAFSQMQPNKESIAAVVKNNKVVGIFTMEDLMEEIVCSICEPR
jgi:CBS domain containing-hemolysin-like protein